MLKQPELISTKSHKQVEIQINQLWYSSIDEKESVEVSRANNSINSAS